MVEIYNTKFKQAGHKIDVATDGKECLKKLGEETYDLLLLDIVLPNIDGWELLKKIKNDDKLAATKIVILSNLGQKEDIDRGMKLGADKYLIKSEHSPSEVAEEVKIILQ